MERGKIYELIDGERDHLNSKEEAIAKWNRRASAERVKELEQQVAELQGDIDDLREHRDSVLLQLAETVAERDDLRTWSDEAATVLTRGLELMPLDQLRQWQGAAAIQQAYYDIVRRGEGQLMTTASAIDATQVMRGMIAVSPVRVAQQPAAPDAGE